MAVDICIAGESGTGKSTSLGSVPELGIKGLNPSETAIVNIMGKPLPFKGSKQSYGRMVSQGGNYAEAPDAATVVRVIEALAKRPDIRYVVVDDSQYIMANEFMNSALEKGYTKFAVIGKNMYDVIMAGKRVLRPDQYFILITHSDVENGSYKLKTIGRMLDEKVNLAGLFTVVLYTRVGTDPETGRTEFRFVTNRAVDANGIAIPAKSPVGMFETLEIPNDLSVVVDSVARYME